MFQDRGVKFQDNRNSPPYKRPVYDEYQEYDQRLEYDDRPQAAKIINYERTSPPRSVYRPAPMRQPIHQPEPMRQPIHHPEQADLEISPYSQAPQNPQPIVR